MDLPTFNTIIRALQFVFATVSIISIASGFKVINGYQVISPDFTFLYILNSSIMIYSGYYLLKYILLQIPLSKYLFVIIFDTVIALCILISGITSATSELYTNCDDLYPVRCGGLTSGIIFTFLNLLTFGFTISYMIYIKKNEKNIISTPTNFENV